MAFATSGRNQPLLANSFVSGVLSRAASAIAPLLLVPLMLAHLGAPVYGVWMAAAGLASILMVCDLGVGLSLLTVLPRALNSGSSTEEHEVLSTAYAVVMAASCVGMTAICFLWAGGHLHELVGTTTLIEGVSTDFVVAAVTLSFLATLPGQLINRVLYSEGRVARSNFIQALVALSALPMVLAAARMNCSPEVILLAAVLPGPAVLIAASLLHFLQRAPSRRPSLTGASVKTARPLVRIGIGLLAISSVANIGIGLDGLILSHFSTAASVAMFAVPQRLYAQLMQLVQIVILPLWPANAAALQRGDKSWIRRSTRRISLISFMATMTFGTLAAFGGRGVLEKWAGNAINFDSGLMLGFTIWCAVQALLSPFFMVLNAAAKLKSQLVAWMVFSVTVAPLKCWFASQDKVALLPLTASIIYLLTLGPYVFFTYRRLISVPTSESSLV